MYFSCAAASWCQQRGTAGRQSIGWEPHNARFTESRTPCSRAPALMRWIQRLRMSRFSVRRSRYTYCRLFSTRSRAMEMQFFARPRKPLAHCRIFLAPVMALDTQQLEAGRRGALTGSRCLWQYGEGPTLRWHRRLRACYPSSVSQRIARFREGRKGLMTQVLGLKLSFALLLAPGDDARLVTYAARIDEARLQQQLAAQRQQEASMEVRPTGVECSCQCWA